MAIFAKIALALSSFGHNFKLALRKLWGLAATRWYVLSALLINIGLWIGTWFLYQALSQDLTLLHYNVDFGIDVIGPRFYLWQIPIWGSLFLLINLTMILLGVKKNNLRLEAPLLLATAILLNLFLGAWLFSVYLINFK